jgi:hypothetical protein
MPYNIRQQPIFISTGDPETVNDPTLQYPGQLGMRATIQQPGPRVSGTGAAEVGRAKTYQLVQTDSTMTVAPFPGAVAFRASSTNPYLVTTNATNRNMVCGVFQNAVTPGNYGFIQVEGPASVKVLDADTAAAAAGDSIIASTTNAKATRLAVGTAVTHTLLGRVQGPTVSTTASEALVVVDLAIPDNV